MPAPPGPIPPAPAPLPKEAFNEEARFNDDDRLSATLFALPLRALNCSIACSRVRPVGVAKREKSGCGLLVRSGSARGIAVVVVLVLKGWWVGEGVWGG